MDLEELLLQAIAGDAALAAIGRISDIVGAGKKIIAGDDEWRDYFDMLSERAACIISVPSLHPSTLWELDQLAKRSLFSKVLMIFTGLHASGKDPRYAIGNLAPELKRSDWDLPTDLTTTSLVSFAPKGVVSFHHADSGFNKRHISRMIATVLAQQITSQFTPRDERPALETGQPF
ncbi:hypothetical protein [Massilia glaciei]|uniref:hypothetical protein n=1 Tax=Massilia glaciei TaxID=1524097 RepID=UPI0011B22185|nr:hypothetical protein [Massilia glaciei]